VGIQLSRKPRIPRTGERGAGAPTFARRGWLDLLHSRLAEVFDIDIPAAGPSFELLSRIALDAAHVRYLSFGVGNVEGGRRG
jgi:hypothetical protein